jgi:hypothetical protein
MNTVIKRVLIGIITVSAFAFSVRVHAYEIKPDALMGMKFTIYLYNADIGSTGISFGENLSLIVDAYDGFGIYLPIGSLFSAFYWAPKYTTNDDLLLIFNGAVLADFISGWGFALPNYKLTSLFLFFGTVEN